MKLNLSRILSLNIIYKIIFLLVFICSIGYLIPDLSWEKNGKVYNFQNFPSVSEKNYKNLISESVRLNRNFVYRIESLNTFESQRDWNNVIAEDQKTLERRVESYLGNNYEIELKNESGKPVFYVYTPSNIQGFDTIVTRNNSDFKISAPDYSSTVTTEEESAEAEQKTIDLNLSRSDFGFADIGAVQGSTTVQFEIKMPIGLIGADKLNIIKNYYASPITVTVGGKDYSGSFMETSSTIVSTEPRNLKLSGITDIADARAVKAFLNTNKFNLGYKLDKIEQIDTNNLLQISSIILIVLIGAVLLNRFTLNNLKLKKLGYILGINLIGLAALKFFGVILTDGYAFVAGLFTLLAIFNTKWNHYIQIILSIIVIKLLGYLYFIDLEWSQILVLVPVSLAIYSTNNIKKINKRYA